MISVAPVVALLSKIWSFTLCSLAKDLTLHRRFVAIVLSETAELIATLANLVLIGTIHEKYDRVVDR